MSTTLEERTRARHWLGAGGEMGKLIRSMDWSRTPLGAIASWPQSLRTTVSLCVASNFPISLAWGPQHVQIYNDGYWPICGKKHPISMGLDFSECWASAWPVIGQAFERALEGETSFLENQRMFLDRNGFLEETFFTFSFSPIQDETGGIGGLFHPVTEVTTKMLSERRTRTVRDLAARAGKAHTTEELLALAMQTLAEAELDVPFSLFYLVDAGGAQARLGAKTGFRAGTAACPDVIDLRGPGADDAPWPLAEVVRTRMTIEVDLSARSEWLAGAFLQEGACGPYPESPKTAFVLPISPPGSERPVAVLVAGVSARLPLDESYRSYFDIVAATITTGLANAQAYAEERRRAEALAEIDRAKTAFFSNVSHEFRTPLTLMLGPLEDELAERAQRLPPARRARLETAYRNTQRLLRLVNTLLDFARIEAGRIQATYEPTDLAAHTAELASVFRSAIERAGMALTVECDTLPEPIYVDREMWEKIVLNLMSNAFKHTFEGRIAVALRWREASENDGDDAGSRTEPGVQLTVSDTGVGVPADELPRLFERFHRVQGTKSRSFEGTGIGLALVQELVGAHSGTIRADSDVGVGTTFTVTVPAGKAHLPVDRIGAERTLPSTGTRSLVYVQEALSWLPTPSTGEDKAISGPVVANGAKTLATPATAKAPASDDTDADMADAGPAGGAVAGTRPRVVWADDNADMREYVSRLLADSYDVQALPNGEAALAAACERPPDLVLSDIMMPGLDGFGLLRELRADRRTRDVPVILLSARAGEESSVAGLAAGADDYLVKPFSARELLARVRTHVELARQRRAWARQLEEANRELESFSYSVSHDLRAPLRAIDGFSKALLATHADQLDPEGRGFLQRVRAATLRMGTLIDALLELARISRVPLRRKAVNLTEIATSVVAELRRQHPARDVTITVEDGLTAAADPRLVAVVLENLIGNAWKFTEKRADTRIRVARAGREAPLAFVVGDNGAGFDPSYSETLFRPFNRLHPKAEFEGTGIGLATVHRVITRHGGKIWAQSAVGEGASFFFTLEAET